MPAIDFTQLPPERLARMAEAGREILAVYRALERGGDNVVGEILRGVETFYEWGHYPEGDVYDRVTHAQYYYHAHADKARGEEHGHFHTFLRPLGMPSGITPAPVPDGAAPKGPNDALSHLIAISMDPMGKPTGLFTTNRWVTAETWYRAEDVAAMVERFEIGHARPSWPTNRWITAMLRLFEPQIVALLHARDRAVADWARAHPGSNVYEDRGLEVTSALPISVEEQIERVARALSRT
ncbi:MAG: hypothetical protein HY521_09495 [Proteobacteria bacterium]|nr:hypothetical protein [Pseudomonadota bacterium]